MAVGLVPRSHVLNLGMLSMQKRAVLDNPELGLVR